MTPEESATWNGTVPDGGALIDSGEHVFNSGLNVGITENSGALRISGGKVNVTAGNVMIALNDNNRNVNGELIVDGTGEFEALNSNIWLPNDKSGTGRLTVAEQGVVHIKELDSKFDNRTGYLTLSGQGSLTIDSDSTAVAQGGSGTSVFTFTTSGQSYFKSPKFQFGDNGADVVHASFNGGTVDASGKEWIAKSGMGSTFVFGGATATIGQMTVEGQSSSDFTNTVEVADGTVTFNGLALRAPTGRNVMMLVSGGTLYLPNKPQVGDSEGSGEAIFRQTGGTVVADKETDLNPKSGTHSTFELLGGIYRGRHIRGLQGSPRWGGTGATTVRADGGTLAPSTAYNSGNNELIYQVPEVRLGAKGLTIDSEGHNPSVCAKFVDDGEGVSGKFVKTGSGTLTVNLKETNGGSGDYANGRSLNSSHASTVVKGGTMLLANQPSDGYCQFGKSVSVADGAVLSLKGSGVTKLVVDDLTLGNGKGISYSTIAMDSGDEIEIGSSLAANAGAIDASWITGDGEYTIFTCASGITVEQSTLDNIVLLNPPSGKDYIWVTSVDKGTGVTTCKIKVGGTLGPHSSIVYTDGAGVVSPEGSTDPIGSISGNGTATDALDLSRVVSASVADGDTLTLGGNLAGGGRTTITKTGSGKLAITGDNSETYRGGFAVDGGILSIEDQSALGSVGILTKNLTLKSGTLAFEGGDTSGVEPITLTIATGENKKPAIVDVAAGASLTVQNIVHQTGALVKKGAGELSLDLGEGSYTIVKNNGNENNNSLISLPATGDSPSDTSALSALTVLEGALRIAGEGADKTTVHATDPVLIGGRYAGVAPSVLTLNDVTMTTDSKHISFGRNVPSGGHASALYMTNSVFMTNKLEFGHDGSEANLEFVLDMKDSTLVDSYKMQFCWGNAAARITADDSTIECTGDNGVIIGRINSAVFTGGNAALRASKSNGTGNAGRLQVYNSNFSEGTELRFENGARLSTTRGVRYENSDNSKGTLSTVFDGGIFEVNASTAEQNCRSRMAQSERQGFTVEDGGLEVAIADGVNHYITFPVRGVGAVVKTGAGALYMTESYSLETSSEQKLLQHTGGTVVSNGTLVVDGSLVADGAKSFEIAEGATLDLNETTLASATISGAGVVTNGTLSAATIAYDADAALTFEDVAFNGALTVDFGCTAENPLDRNAGKAGITVAHYTGDAPVIAKVVPANTGIARAKAKVVCDAGDIVVTVEQSGLAVVIR
ncbi:MAG: autotransporter-associated beta strand repeat-containing protein [Kiritimatiellae bacterium]|nr:autotransporter-associated beta strand repeat-containing protein [Kiritimatiellia bacterium]